MCFYLPPPSGLTSWYCRFPGSLTGALVFGSSPSWSKKSPIAVRQHFGPWWANLQPKLPSGTLALPLMPDYMNFLLCPWEKYQFIYSWNNFYLSYLPSLYFQNQPNEKKIMIFLMTLPEKYMQNFSINLDQTKETIVSIYIKIKHNRHSVLNNSTLVPIVYYTKTFYRDIHRFFFFSKSD